MKRRTVLWLSQYDYNYFSQVVESDNDQKNRAFTRILRFLKSRDVTSFLTLDSHFSKENGDKRNAA